MDRSWIIASRISDEYEKGVEEFLQFAKRNRAGVNNKYFFLCVNCLNVRRQNIELIQERVQYFYSKLNLLNSLWTCLMI